MAQARIHVDLPDGRWKSDISHRYSTYSFQIRGMMSGDCATETVGIPGRKTNECISDIESHSLVDSLDVIEEHRNGVKIYLETIDPIVYSSITQAGTPLVCPAELKCGELTVTVVGPKGAISSLGTEFQDNGMEFELASIQPDHDKRKILTDRQEEVLFTAIEGGYYQNPRECTLTEVAETLEIAKSTCSGTLQRAEEAVVEYYCLQQQLSKQQSG